MVTSVNPLTGTVAYSNFPRRAIFNSSYQVVYLDLNAQYTVNTQPLRIENLDAVSEKILNVMSTMPGERPFEPLFGSAIKTLLFSPMSVTLINDIQDATRSALVKWVPEIVLNVQNSNFNMDTLHGIIYISLVYSVPALGAMAQSSLSITRPA